MFNNFNQITDTSPPSTRIVVPVAVFAPNNPPPFRPVSNIPAPLAAALPVIASTLANRLGEVAAQNPVFCFLYNRVTLNAMQNPEWQKLVEATTYHTWYNINTKKYPNEEAALADACKSVLMVYSAYIATQVGEMRGLLSIPQQNEVVELAKRWPVFVEQYQRLENEARSVHSSMQNSFQGGFAQQQSVAAAWGQPGTQNVGATTGGLSALAPTATYVAPGQNIAPANNQATSYYDEPQQPVFRPSRKEMFIPGINDKDAKATKQEPPRVPPKASFLSHVTEIASGKVTHHDRNVNPIQTATADEWNPSPFQPYHPAYRYYQEPIYEVQVDASGMRRVIAIINDKETAMDRTKHNFTSSASYFTAFGGAHAETEVKVAHALTETAKAILSGSVGENEEATKLYSSLGVIDNEPVEVPPQTSLRALVSEARVFQMASGSNELTFLVSSAISHQIVSRTNHLEVIQKLRTMSLEAGATWLKKMVEELKNNGDFQDVGFLQFLLGVDRAIKKELLTVIRFRMGVGSDFNFDSFMDDEEDIRNALRSVHGVSHLKSYTKIQAHLLPTMLAEFGVEVSPIKSNEDDTPALGWITSISPMVTMLLLNISDEQLGLQLPDGAVCEVFPDTFPGLYDFITGVVKSNPGALHHYIATVDDVVYEVNVGLVGENHMVLTRVHCDV